MTRLFESDLVNERNQSRRDVEKSRRILKELLLSRFNGLSAWATTNACIFLDHPDRSETHHGCACGKRKP
jgi:hypothetical protein